MILAFLRSLSPWATAAFGLTVAALLALILALFGWFSGALTLIPLLLLFAGFAGAIITLIRSRDWTRVFLLGLLALLALGIALRAEPTVFSGRDQGSLALTAWNLAKHHELAFTSPAATAFFQIYGPGTALNFPGFAYTNDGSLITQFPLGYTGFVALFVSWLGMAGFLTANAVLFIFSGWSFFELLSLFFTKRNALYGTALFVLSFLMVWLAQMTLTENLALALFLTLAITLVQLSRNADARLIPLVFLAGFLFAMTRIEGFVIFPLALAFLLYQKPLRTLLLERPIILMVIPGLVMGFLFLRDFFMNLPFYTMIGKALLKYTHEATAPVTTLSEPSLGPIFFSYGLFVVFVLGIGALLFSLTEKRWGLAGIALLASPTLLYLVDGHISDDHPWLLRRYAFTLFPLFIFFVVAFWERLSTTLSERFRSSGAPLFFLILFAFQVWPFLQALDTIEGHTLFTQTKNFSETFTDRDLILIDRKTTGDPFTMLTGPLADILGKNAVYFFNPEDLARLDRSAFERTFLLTPEDSLGLYMEAFEGELLPVEVITFSSPTLEALKPYAPPKSGKVTSDAILFEVTLPLAL